MMRKPQKLLRTAAGLVLLSVSLVAAAPTDNSAQIDSLMSRYHEYGLFNGSVLVADGGTVIFKKGFGFANMEWEIPNTPDTKFRLGSVTKQFTAALILQFANEGKINLGSLVADYVPECPKPAADNVTIHHLLTHTSGIPNYTAMPRFRKDMVRNPYAPVEFLQVFADKELDFEPGSKYSYSNSGYFLLGVVIEKVTGQPYQQVLRERILVPLQMHDTGYDRHRTRLARRAGAYESTLDGYVNAAYLDMSAPYAAGALYSTVEDLYTWDQALHGEKVLPANYKELMFTGHVKMPDPKRSSSYGYGWIIETVPSPVGGGKVLLISHGGGINGFNTLIQRMPEQKRLIVLLNNTGGAKLQEMSAGIRAILYGGSPKMPRKPVSGVLYETYLKQGTEAALQQYRELKEGEPGSYDFHWMELGRLGRHLLETKRAEDAIKVFELNAEAYPKQSMVYVGLADAYREAGNKKLAVQNYAEALELNPDSPGLIVERLSQLTQK